MYCKDIMFYLNTPLELKIKICPSAYFYIVVKPKSERSANREPESTNISSLDHKL